jgi:hypothetical protein
VALNGSSQYLSRASTTDLNLGDEDFTFQVWIKPDVNTGTRNIIDKLINPYLQYAVYMASGVPNLWLNGASRVAWGAALSSGTWYLIHAWHDAANNVVGIVVDAGTPVTASYSGGLSQSVQDFNLGRYAGGSSYVDGVLDEVAVWKRVLTSDDRTALYNGGSGLAYPFAAGSAVVPWQVLVSGQTVG